MVMVVGTATAFWLSYRVVAVGEQHGSSKPLAVSVGRGSNTGNHGSRTAPPDESTSDGGCRAPGSARLLPDEGVPGALRRTDPRARSGTKPMFPVGLGRNRLSG